MQTITFAELGLSAKVQAAITAAGYSNPTPIQQQAIPVAVTGKDVLGIAQTGTGKTAGFVLPMLTRLETGRARARMPRSLILAPTRELAAQVAQSFEKYGVNHRLNVALLIGGVSFDDQLRKLDRGADVLIATPGRLLDHFQRGKILMTGVEILVIDEADRMLDMGFIPDIERITKMLPFTRQTLFFSATMPPEITRLADQFLSNPERIEVAKPATAASTIEQKIVALPSNDPKMKREALRRIVRGQTVTNGIVFCNRKTDVDIVYKSFSKHGFSVAALHGDLPQPVRMKTLDSFRAGDVQLLVASDVAARGLDIPAVSHVFNFDVPHHADDYVHRIGRTGRAGRQGHAFMLVGPADAKYVGAIEKLTGKPIEREEMNDIEVAPDRFREGRGGERRGGRDRDRRRGKGDRREGPKHEHVASMEPIDPNAIAAANEQPAERPRREDRPRNEHRDRPHRDRQPRKDHPRPPKAEGAQHERRDHHEKRDRHEKRPPREPRQKDDNANEPARAGLGDHTPAFLLRPVPQHLIKRKKEAEPV